MKKFFMMFVLLVISLFAVGGFSNDKVYAQTEFNDEADIVFEKNLEEMLVEQGYIEYELLANKQIIYDIDLKKLGYVYDFDLNFQKGFAIVIKTEIGFEMTEIYFDSTNPYGDLNDDNLPIYFNNMTYAYYNNDNYYWAYSNSQISQEDIEEIRSIAYCGYDDLVISSEIITFSNRTETSNNIVSIYPICYDIDGLNNACVPIAASSLIVFYDRYKSDLIPNYIPGMSMGANYIYKAHNEDIESVIRQLYADMGTNTTSSGTTVPQFKSGMNKYCNRAGYSFSYTSCMSSNSFNFELAKQKLEQGIPIILFVNKFSVASLTCQTNSESIEYVSGNLLHSMGGFGYKEITYNLTDGSTRVDKYIAVCGGVNACKKGYYNINRNTTVNDAYAIVIE